MELEDGHAQTFLFSSWSSQIKDNVKEKIMNGKFLRNAKHIFSWTVYQDELWPFIAETKYGAGSIVGLKQHWTISSWGLT